MRVELFGIEYRKISNNGPSEKRTTSLQRTYHLPLIDFTIYRTNTFRTTEKQTPLNSVQRTLMSSRLTLANTKLLSETDSETTLVDRFRMIVRHRR